MKNLAKLSAAFLLVLAVLSGLGGCIMLKQAWEPITAGVLLALGVSLLLGPAAGGLVSAFFGSVGAHVATRLNQEPPPSPDDIQKMIDQGVARGLAKAIEGLPGPITRTVTREVAFIPHWVWWGGAAFFFVRNHEQIIGWLVDQYHAIRTRSLKAAALTSTVRLGATIFGGAVSRRAKEISKRARGEK